MSRLILIISTILLIIILLIGFLFLRKQESTVPQPQPTTTPQASPLPTVSTNEELRVTSTTPQDKSVDQSTKTPLMVVFNRQPKLADIKVTLTPITTFLLSLKNSALFIDTAVLLPNTQYTIKVSLPNRSEFSYTFQTGSSSAVNTRPNQTFIDEENNDLKSNRPDLYLDDRVPFENDFFSIKEGELKSSPTSHFTFIVTYKKDSLSSGNTLKEWLKSLALTDEQINRLEFIYQ